jgi:hypothetical protein
VTRTSRALRLVVLLLILACAVYVLFSSGSIRRLGRLGEHDVADVLEGKVTDGSVKVRGIVDLIEPESDVVFLKDLKQEEVCVDSVCMFAVIKVHTRERFAEGDEAVVTGVIGEEDGFPVIISN